MEDEDDAPPPATEADIRKMLEGRTVPLRAALDRVRAAVDKIRLDRTASPGSDRRSA